MTPSSASKPRGSAWIAPRMRCSQARPSVSCWGPRKIRRNSRPMDAVREPHETPRRLGFATSPQRGGAGFRRRGVPAAQHPRGGGSGGGSGAGGAHMWAVLGRVLGRVLSRVLVSATRRGCPPDNRGRARAEVETRPPAARVRGRGRRRRAREFRAHTPRLAVHPLLPRLFRRR